MERPNIILINCDDLGYGDLGCYGSTVNPTPTLDRMAAEGMRMTDFYMVSPVCSPSRGGMLTGCYPNRIGFDLFEGIPVLFPGHPVGLNPKENTIASLLKKEGYATKLVGKWHCGDQPEFLPTKHGFDSYFGLPYSNDMGRQANNREKFVHTLQSETTCNYLGPDSGELDSDFPPLPLMENDTVLQEQPDQAALTERYVGEAVRFIRDNRKQPFFLYFAHMYVHLPIYVPQPYLDSSRNGRYGAAVGHVDWSVAVLMDELRRQGLDRNTLVVFTSDNGSRARDEGGSNAPLRGTKATTWEGGMRLPCIAWWPGHIPAGSTSSEICASFDFLPTFLELAGTKPPSTPEIDGRSIAPLWRGEDGARSPHEAFCYFHKGSLEAVRKGKWKLHLYKPGEDEIRELYDLASDIGETTDRSADHPGIVAELEALAAAKREELGDRRLGIVGNARRPVGRVDNPDSLTHFNPDHPYFLMEYDLKESG